uniref:uncharacterized protein LOC122593717 n=1 Tax=Erigeron canadensis TaxID=72917 RepID=UPI001CB998FF|nr:uncharacterized protein LOC122593717 [Erigeron canadensis]
MRKLYNHNKHKIHPSPPPTSAPPTTTINHLSILPPAIATLAAALSLADQEVLAYLISSSISTKPTNQFGGCEGGGYHAPQFNCNCFSCYTSYWVRWDCSKNRQLIHEIIDAYEDGLIHNKKNKKHRKKNKVSPQPPPPQVVDSISHAPPPVEESSGEDEDDVGQDKMVTSEKGSVRKVVNFIGSRIWGVWGV